MLPLVGCTATVRLYCPSDPRLPVPQRAHHGAGGLLEASFGGGARVPLCSQGKLGVQLLCSRGKLSVQLLSRAASAQAKPWVMEKDLQGPGCIIGVFPDASCRLSASLLILVVIQIPITIQSAVALIPALGRWQWHPG